MYNLTGRKQHAKDKYAVGLFAAIISFSAYTCIFSFRKAFNVASFSGYTLLGMDYKVVLVITQVMGYMTSTFYGIKFIAELKRMGRGKLIFLLVSISWAAWLLFALLPPPYNFLCLFVNGFPLGMLWGIVFSYIEGRRTTDLISATLAVSFIFASGLSKSTAQYVMNSWHVGEYWMPFVTGLIFMPPLLLFVFLLEKIPPPDEEDIAERMERVPMPKERRKQLVKSFLPGIVALVFIYILVTILRELRDSFMADMWRESGQEFKPAVFAQTESIISVIILVIIAAMVIIKNNFRAFMFAHFIMFIGFMIALVITVLFTKANLPLFYWMIFVGLGLYMVYIPFNSILFDRFIAAFRYSGNVGFLIYIADSFGYLGSVSVLSIKTIFHINLNWLDFYSKMVIWVGIFGLMGVSISMIYFASKRQVKS